MEKLLKYLPFHLLICLIFGITAQYYCNYWQFGFFKLSILLIVFLMVLFILNYLKLKKAVTLFLWIFFILIGISTVYFQDCRNHKEYYMFSFQENSSAVLTIEKVLKSSFYYNKYQAKVTQVDGLKSVGKVLLNINKDSVSNDLKIGEQIFLKPNFKEVEAPLNPHQFNYKAYLFKKGMYHQLFIKKGEYTKLKNTAFSFFKLSGNFRNKVQKSLKKRSFKKNEYAVINALLLGQRQEISKDLLEDYSRAGAIHILAISGLHIGVLLLILNILFKRLDSIRNGSILKSFLIILFLWMFAFIAGLSASVVRAVTMFTFIALGQSFKRKKIIEHSLVTSMFLLLLLKPMFLFDVGFQLSYLAVFGIIWFQPILYNLWSLRWIFFEKVWQLLTVSTAAQMSILPLSLYYFHQFPSLFMLSNLVIIPFLGIILFGGILVIILSLLEGIPQILADSYGFIIQSMNSFVSWISFQENFLLQDISISFRFMLFWYIFMIGTFLCIVKKKAKNVIICLISFVLIQVLLIFENFNRNKKQEFIVFHQPRASVIAERKGSNLNIYQSLNYSKRKIVKTISAYKIAENVKVNYLDKKLNAFQFKNKQILIVDSLGIYKLSNLNKPIVLLQNSPKINLERLIKTLRPSQIIADGSNYKTYIDLWKKTCKKEKTPFYYTGQNGAYIINKEPF